MQTITYRGIRFDDYTENDEYNNWSLICKSCVQKYRVPDICLDIGGPAAGSVCGVEGCENEAYYYIDMVYNLEAAVRYLNNENSADDYRDMINDFPVNTVTNLFLQNMITENGELDVLQIRETYSEEFAKNMLHDLMVYCGCSYEDANEILGC